MRRFRQLLVLLFVVGCIHSVSAQRRYRMHERKSQPAVYLIAVEQDGTLYEAYARGRAADDIMVDFAQTRRTGFQQVVDPQFIFTTKNNRFSLGIGGYINLRTSYDFMGAVDNIDFIPYDIPLYSDYANRQRVMMDATTSRLLTKAVINSPTIGPIIAFIDMDFRGGAEGSYTPRLRSAYVSFKGLTLGRDVTTFCDLSAAPTTIDFQGPNAYNFNFATLIRYEVSFARRHMTFGVAAELPSVSATYGENFKPIHQRVPDFPMYLQYAWGADRSSHLRASAVLRNPYMYKVSKDATTSLFGWGVQLSGTIKCCDWFRMFMNGVYGKGITPYIQDLTGSGLDFTPNPVDPTLVRMMPMWGVQAAGQINFTPRLFVSGGYSTVRVQRSEGYYTADQYKQGQYIFGNIFYSLTPRCKVAAEYLYGSRKDMNSMKNHANRVNVMVQYNF